MDTLLADIAPSVPPTEPDGHIPAASIYESRAWRVITIAGFEPSLAERQALHAIAAQHQTLIQIHSDAAPPHSWELLVLQDMDGQALNRAGMLDQFWHTPPYAMPLRLVRYAPNSCEGEVVDGAVISTRDERRCFPHAGRADGGEAGRQRHRRNRSGRVQLFLRSHAASSPPMAICRSLRPFHHLLAAAIARGVVEHRLYHKAFGRNP